MKNQIVVFILLLQSFNSSIGFFTSVKIEDDCFCQLHGQIDDCTCSVNTVDHFNNVKIYPRLKSLLSKPYFRFYRVNLARACPFWADDTRCAMRHCHVLPCAAADLPAGLQAPGAGARRGCEADHDPLLGYLNTSISAQLQEELALWGAHDDAQDNFCVWDEDGAETEHVDLLLNPERYTGYRGRSARRIWTTIYAENCFRSSGSARAPALNRMCLEERVFYRAISGLHASINVHLCAQYLLAESLARPGGQWGANVAEFQRRFGGEEGAQWLRNLYFVYLVELRALAKAGVYLQKEEFYTGNEVDDFDTQLAVRDLLHVVRQFSHHFNESTMFGDSEQAEELKNEFKVHFRNVSRIMNCVGCDKCKLWGILQTQGLGTALKILFSGRFDDLEIEGTSKKEFQLKRTEIVALLNSIGRLSTSIYELDEFRNFVK